jgi:hypothetical protein
MPRRKMKKALLTSMAAGSWRSSCNRFYLTSNQHAARAKAWESMFAAGPPSRSASCAVARPPPKNFLWSHVTNHRLAVAVTLAAVILGLPSYGKRHTTKKFD